MNGNSPQVVGRSTINVDYTHVGRRASGIERITVEQFNSDVLSPLQVNRLTAASRHRQAVVFAQMVQLPIHALRNPQGVYVFPGFPPAPYFSRIRSRCVLFVHDLFLLTRRSDLNNVGKYYMAPLFKLALKGFQYFLTNSESTSRELKVFCQPDAQILSYRPYVRNVFDLTEDDRATRPTLPGKLHVVAIGTVEPRKNFGQAVRICEALAEQLRVEVELHIVGRFGWGPDVRYLNDRPNVTLHGYVDDSAVRSIISQSDLMLCTSHDEGLCLPLIEVQYCGIPVIAPDQSVFREVLGDSGIFIQPREPQQAAKQIADVLTAPFWRSKYGSAGKTNIVRWNSIAEADRGKVTAFLSNLASSRARTGR
jgi:glycosyltransferase involved in cell wall biosynthesis